MKFNPLILPFGFSAFFGFYCFLCILKCRETWSWTETDGTIIKLKLSVSRGDFDTPDKNEIISYQYEVQGEIYHNNVVTMGVEFRLTTDSYSTAEDRLNQYSLGEKLSVYYNPRNPKESCLTRGQSFGNFLGLIIALCLIAFFLMLLIL